jgi:hypothetical protein
MTGLTMQDANFGLDVLPYIFLCIFLIVFVFAWIESHAKPMRNRKMDAEWYADKYPHAIKDDHITCYICASEKIGTRPGIKHTHPQQHYCKECDTILYYSVEQP